ncbi:MAG: hypothetical protein AAF721_13365 [Myxococcota bacterium]
MSVLRRLLGRRDRRTSSDGAPRLRAAGEVVAAYRGDGANETGAIHWTLRQLEGLGAEVDDDERWARLCELVRRAGDPWNADDWPLGFDALLCCVPLCTHVDFECARCPVGKTQDGMSCAHPHSAFGTVWELIRARDRHGLRAQIERLTRLLS